MPELRESQGRGHSAAGRTSSRVWLVLAVAAGFGLLLGAVGLYGVISFVSTQRTREIGVRMALGAEAGSVRGMVLRQGLAVTGAGVGVGSWGHGA